MRGLDIIQFLYQIKMPLWPLEHKGRSSLAVPISPLYHITPLPQAGPAPRHNERWKGLGLPATCSRCCIIWDRGINPYISLFHLPRIKGNPCQSGDTTHVEEQGTPRSAADSAGTNAGLSLGVCSFNSILHTDKMFCESSTVGCCN